MQGFDNVGVLTQVDIYFTVFRTRDLLVRIRIFGSVPSTNGSGSGSFPFRFKTPTKNNFSAYFLFEGTYILYNSSKKESHKEVKTVDLKIFLPLLLVDVFIRINYGSECGARRPKNIQDSGHSFILTILILNFRIGIRDT